MFSTLKTYLISCINILYELDNIVKKLVDANNSIKKTASI